MPFDYGKYFGEIRLIHDLTTRADERTWRLTAPEPRPARKSIVLYLGCNVLRTSHMIRTVTAVFDLLELDYVTVGGPTYCCGIVHHREGDTAAGEGMAKRTLQLFERYAPDEVVMWCPSCIYFYDDVMHAQVPYRVRHTTEFLLAQLPRITFTRRVERAVAVHPFGPQRAQIQVANEAATLIALRRLDDADRVARDLTGTFATYIRLMRGAAADQWSTMDSLARTTMDAPSSPGFLKVPATAVAAGTLAVRGAVGASDSLLAAAMVRASPDVARWYQRARLLLAQASGRPMPPLPAALARDQSPAALVTAGLTAAMAGDSARAGAVLRALDRADSVELRTLGQGPLLIRAWLAARAGDWSRAASLVDAPARRGEHDTAILDRVGSQSLRWLAADALARSGRMPDAAAMLELAIAPERMSGNEFALRGVALTFAHARLARWYETMGRRHDAAAHWRAVRDALQNPDASVLPLLTEARSSLSRLAGN